MSRQLHKHLPCFTYHQSKYYFVHTQKQTYMYTDAEKSKSNHHDIGSFHKPFSHTYIETLYSTSN